MRVALVGHVLNPAALLEEVSSPSCGATSLFIGTVRNVNEGREVTGIEYTSYAAMATAELDRIAHEAAERFGTDRIVVEHRIGTLTLGEASIAIVVAHERRAPAMDASRYLIEQIKKRVPIWKLEHYADGTREWVDPTRAPEAMGQAR